MARQVIDRGARKDDVSVLETTRDHRLVFDSLLQQIDQLRRKSHNEGSDIDRDELNDLKYLYAQLPRIQTCDQYSKPLDSLHLPKIRHSQAWAYVILTQLEELVLTLKTCMLDYQISQVGMNDLSFSAVPFARDGIGATLDSVELNHALMEESYDFFIENAFQHVQTNPLSTFGADVDVASYANVRRYLEFGVMPPKGAVRLEELVNYFEYSYPPPVGETPVSLVSDFGDCPWNDQHQLLRIALRSRDMLIDTPFEELPPNNLVFLIDVSGSMEAPQKLPLVKRSLQVLTEKLRPEDRVSIVVYASETGVVLPPTTGRDKTRILQAIKQLSAGGSTAGGAGIKMAYELARQNFLKTGNNRVIIATDGDFNVGVSTENELFDLISGYRDTGIFLTVLGFGMGHYKDTMLRTLSNYGNGNYAYIDSPRESRNVFEAGFMGTLYTVARDVKLQVEFNPAFVQGYRLLGYEDRILPPEGYADDQVGAGDMGSGHTVTAFYEIIPTGVASGFLPDVPGLKYQNIKTKKGFDEWGTVRFRYKHPDQNNSEEVVTVFQPKDFPESSDDFKLSSAVVEFGLLLRQSAYRSKADYTQVKERLRTHLSAHPDKEKWEELLNLVEIAARLEDPE